jgi:hypothetical protein
MSRWQIEIRRLEAAEVHAHLDALAAVLEDCVAGGASVGYLAPFSRAPARAAFEAFAAESSRAAGCFSVLFRTAGSSARFR